MIYKRYLHANDDKSNDNDDCKNEDSWRRRKYQQMIKRKCQKVSVNKNLAHIGEGKGEFIQRFK